MRGPSAAILLANTSGPGHRYDTIGVAPLIKGVEFAALIADKAFDANWIVQEMDERGAKGASRSDPSVWHPGWSTRTCTNGAT